MASISLSKFMNLLRWSMLINCLFLSVFLLLSWRNREDLVQTYVGSYHTPRVAMLGDSHIEFGKWSFLLKRTDILRVGRGNFTSWQTRVILMPAVLAKRPKICFVQCGSNDAYQGEFYNTANTMQNYQAIADSLVANDINPVFQTVPYRVNQPAFNRRVDSLNAMLTTYCRLHNINLININRLFPLKNLRFYTVSDGVHFNDSGYRIWSEALTHHLEKMEQRLQ